MKKNNADPVKTRPSAPQSAEQGPRERPVIYWHSDPVGPDETVLLTGHALADAVVEFARLADAEPGKPGQTSPSETLEWTTVQPLETTPISLKAVLPADWKPGLFACRVRSGRLCSEIATLNAPEVWWFQGDEGSSRGRVGGWLRVFGKNLGVKKPAAALCDAEGHCVELRPRDATPYQLAFDLPPTLKTGEWTLWIHNGAGGATGWRRAGTLTVLPASDRDARVVNILDFGADPKGLKDSTLAIVWAMSRLSTLGEGGVVYFPRGRYRIDGNHRSGLWGPSALKIPAGITLRGESADLVSLWWPDRAEPLPTLIEGGDRFGIEDLSIYAQGTHRNLITGENHLRFHRLRIRVNCHYMTNGFGKPHHKRGVEDGDACQTFGSAFQLWGENIQITDCDIFFSGCGFSLKHCRGAYIARNRVLAGNMVGISGGEHIIFENNSTQGNTLSCGGNSFALHFGASMCRHFYYAHNHVAHLYGGDHEALTFDGHGTAYFGRAESAAGSHVVLARPPTLGRGTKDSLLDLYHTAVYVLEGRGAGQYRFVTGWNDRRVELDRPWDVAPDATSILSIGGFNGRHIIVGNTAEDAGTLVQLYPPNCECIVADNIGIHSSSINSNSNMGLNLGGPWNRIEPSWYHLFLDNHIVHGNGWGGGTSVVNRWLGGEAVMNIWGAQTAFTWGTTGSSQEQIMQPEHLRQLLGELPDTDWTIPISAFQVIRRHRVDNNSHIRVKGAVRDVVIEHCHIAMSEKGIRIDAALDWSLPPDIGQLAFEPEAASDEHPVVPFQSPRHVLIRNNRFDAVEQPHCGTWLDNGAIIVDTETDSR